MQRLITKIKKQHLFKLYEIFRVFSSPAAFDSSENITQKQ